VVETVVGDIGDEAEEYRPPSPPLSEPAEPGPSFTESVFADSLTHAPDKGITETLETPASEIMDTDVVWSRPDDSVEHVMEKMQQHNTGYVLIGANGVLEGIVSNSNLLGAVSPYLRPMFAQWRRSEDDATLQIKIKWIMSRPVRTVTPDTTLGSLAESMRRYGGRCLPVVDSQGKVQGIITVFDIMLRFLQAGQAFSWKGKPPQGPPLLI
jgi:CBS domain-containing protein